MKVVLAGGGTAGHIEPALNLADELRLRHPEIEIVALGTERGLETSLVPARGYELQLIPAVPLPRKISGDLVSLPIRLRTAIAECRKNLTDADVLVGFGGYVSLPAYFAARGHVPIVVHEANARPGLANRVGARFASAVAETVKGSLPHAVLTGIPLRQSIANFDRASSLQQARQHFGIPENAIVLLVFGGSQGAAKINDVMEQARTRGYFDGVYVIHAIGKKNDLPQETGEKYRVVHYLDRMDLAYAAADFVIGRSGAVTVAEVTAVGLPACFVPLPIGNGEQTLNARAVAQSGGAIIVADADFSPDFVAEQIVPLLLDQKRRSDMARVSAQFGHRGASAALADLVENVVKGRK